MRANDLRNNIVALVRTPASSEKQLAYQSDVPRADVAAELVCMWFDDLYHPGWEMFQEAFDAVERDRLALFHAFYDQRQKQLPGTHAEMQANREWLEVTDEAKRVLADLGWIADQ